MLRGSSAIVALYSPWRSVELLMHPVSHISIWMLCVWWYLLASSGPCHQIFANTDRTIAEHWGTFAPGGPVGCLLLLSPKQNPNLFPSRLTGWEYQLHYPLILYLSFVFLHVEKKFRFTTCFPDHCKALIKVGCVWGGKNCENFFLELFFFTLVNQWSGSCSSMRACLQNCVFLKKMFCMCPNF